jgi:hypothetical protein
VLNGGFVFCDHALDRLLFFNFNTESHMYHFDAEDGASPFQKNINHNIHEYSEYKV